MVGIDMVVKLAKAFPGGFLNGNGEFIAHKKSNEYIGLIDCETEIDVKCKVLEWFSRGAHKTKPFSSSVNNRAFNIFMLEGINKFLETNFSIEDMEQIYTCLGNRINHKKTMKFIESGYDMEILREE